MSTAKPISQIAAVLALALLAGPLQAKNGADDYFGEVEHQTYADSEKMTDAQKAEAKADEKSAKEYAKSLEKSAKAAAKAAKAAAKGQSAVQRAAVAAQGDFEVKYAKLAYENRVYQSLLNIAEAGSVDVSELPDPEDILLIMRDRVSEAKDFYESMVTTALADRAAALASRQAELALEASEQAAFISGLNQLQFEVLDAALELAEEIIDVAEAKAEADDKQYLANLPTDLYLAELAARKAAKVAADDNLAQYDLATRVWAKRAIEAGELLDEIEDAIDFVNLAPE